MHGPCSYKAICVAIICQLVLTKGCIHKTIHKRGGQIHTGSPPENHCPQTLQRRESNEGLRVEQERNIA